MDLKTKNSFIQNMQMEIILLNKDLAKSYMLNQNKLHLLTLQVKILKVLQVHTMMQKIQLKELMMKLSDYLKIKFKGSDSNTQAIGAKVFAYAKNFQLRQEQNLSRGYISAVAPGLHLGLGAQVQLDSLLVVYPDKSYQILKDVAADQTLMLDQQEASGNFYERKVSNYFMLTSLNCNYRF